MLYCMPAWQSLLGCAWRSQKKKNNRYVLRFHSNIATNILRHRANCRYLRWSLWTSKIQLSWAFLFGKKLHKRVWLIFNHLLDVGRGCFMMRAVIALSARAPGQLLSSALPRPGRCPVCRTLNKRHAIKDGTMIMCRCTACRAEGSGIGYI